MVTVAVGVLAKVLVTMTVLSGPVTVIVDLGPTTVSVIVPDTVTDTVCVSLTVVTSESAQAASTITATSDNKTPKHNSVFLNINATSFHNVSVWFLLFLSLFSATSCS
jgi:hypothetical protein